MSLAIVTVARNEAGRFLPSMLPAWSDFADAIIFLDDGSTDGTRELCAQFPKVDYHFQDDKEGLWGRESGSRKHLFELALQSDHDWLMWLDADMIPARDPSPLMVGGVDAIAFLLYDLWNNDHYRDDTFWSGHRNPRIWAIHNPGRDFIPDWNPRGMHCGHLPANLAPERTIVPTLEFSLLHYAYSSPALRQRKFEQYMEQADKLSQREQDHARSIIDSEPRLLKLPIPITWKIELESSQAVQYARTIRSSIGI